MCNIPVPSPLCRSKPSSPSESTLVPLEPRGLAPAATSLSIAAPPATASSLSRHFDRLLSVRRAVLSPLSSPRLVLVSSADSPHSRAPRHRAPSPSGRRASACCALLLLLHQPGDCSLALEFLDLPLERARAPPRPRPHAPRPAAARRRACPDPPSCCVLAHGVSAWRCPCAATSRCVALSPLSAPIFPSLTSLLVHLPQIRSPIPAASAVMSIRASNRRMNEREGAADESTPSRIAGGSNFNLDLDFETARNGVCTTCVPLSLQPPRHRS